MVFKGICMSDVKDREQDDWKRGLCMKLQACEEMSEEVELETVTIHNPTLDVSTSTTENPVQFLTSALNCSKISSSPAKEINAKTPISNRSNNLRLFQSPTHLHPHPIARVRKRILCRMPLCMCNDMFCWYRVDQFPGINMVLPLLSALFPNHLIGKHLQS